MQGIVQGVVTHIKDDGKIATMLHLTGIEFSDYDQEADVCLGKSVESIYLNRKVECKPGDLVNVDYRPGYQGRAQVDKVSIVKKKSE